MKSFNDLTPGNFQGVLRRILAHGGAGGASCEPPPPRATKTINKAGLILHGMATHDPATGLPLTKPTHYIVAPWSEGRFSDDGRKQYFLASGSVDEGEAVLDAAKREAFEETGIHIDDIMGGQVAGVKLAAPMMRGYERDILDLMDRPLYSCIYPVELQGIEQLAQACHRDGSSILKNRSAQEGGDFAPNIAEEKRIEHYKPPLPSFADLIRWLRSGDVPQAEWNAGRPHAGTTLQTATRFEAIEKSGMQAVIERRSEYTDDGNSVLPGGRQPGDLRPMILNPTEFGIWRDNLSAEDQQWVDAKLAQMKAVLRGQLQVLPADDCATIKLDTRDRLKFYQEGTDILPVSEYLSRIYEGAMGSKYYGRSMMNVQDADYFAHGYNHHASNAIAKKQISLLAPVLTEDDIRQARIPQHAKHILYALRSQYQHENVQAR